MSSFRYFREKKNRTLDKLNPTQINYVDKLFEFGDKILSENKDILPEAAIDTAFQEILNDEIEELEISLKGAVLYALDRLKEKYPPKLNISINNGESKNDKER